MSLRFNVCAVVLFLILIFFLPFELLSSALFIRQPRKVKARELEREIKTGMCSKAAYKNEQGNNKTHEIISFNYYDNSYCVYINTNMLICMQNAPKV